MSIVNIQWSELIKNMLPGVLHGANHKNWLYSLIKPLQHVHDLFYAFYDKKNFFLKHTFQTVYLEHFLNYKYNIDNPLSSHVPTHDYNATNKDIYIVNNDITDKYLFNLSEVIPSSDEIYLYNDSEYPLGAGSQELYLYNKIDVNLGYNFTVYVPDNLLLAKPWSDMSMITGLSPAEAKIQINKIISATIEKFKFANITYELTEY